MGFSSNQEFEKAISMIDKYPDISYENLTYEAFENSERFEWKMKSVKMIILDNYNFFSEQELEFFGQAKTTHKMLLRFLSAANRNMSQISLCGKL